MNACEAAPWGGLGQKGGEAVMRAGWWWLLRLVAAVEEGKK